MFYYRASAETSLKRWGSILDDNFQLVLPITPYRSFPPAEVSPFRERYHYLTLLLSFLSYSFCFLPSRSSSNSSSSHSICPPFTQVVAGQRRVNGVEAMIVDTTSLSVMVQSIGLPHKDGDKVRYLANPPSILHRLLALISLPEKTT